MVDDVTEQLPERIFERLAARVAVRHDAVQRSRLESPLTAPAQAPVAALLDALGATLAGESVREARLLDGPDGPVLGVVPYVDGPIMPALRAFTIARCSAAWACGYSERR